MYSLWRNNVQLGRLTHVSEEMDEQNEPLGLTGLLYPLTLLDALGTVKQTRYVNADHAAVVQEFPRQPEPEPAGNVEYIPSCVIPPPAFMLLDKDGRGVPDEFIFSIRREDGSDVPSYIISIDRNDLPEETDHSEALREAGLPGDLRSVFHVTLIHESAYPPRHIVEYLKNLPPT